ncbi:hypothetical protein KCU95_g11263, partial [Aureobasidium melanogenum]
MATSVLNQSLGLVHLPTEVLIDIFEHVPDKDLPAARLVCKKLCDAATPRFATVNFTERFHAVSPYSIDALVGITEHPVFGKYVKAVSIYSARRTRISKNILRRSSTIHERDNRDDYVNAYVKTGRFARRMERVFRNIKSRSKSVVINLYDHPGFSALQENPFFSFLPSIPMKCYGWTQLFGDPSASSVHIAYRPVETLEQTVYAARRVGCPVKCLNIDFFECHDPSLDKRLDAALYRILQSTPTSLSLSLGSMRSCGLSYTSFRWLIAGLPLHASYRWLQTKRIAQIRVAKLSYFPYDLLRPFFTPSLTSLELSEMSVWTKDFEQNLWSTNIQIISALPGLQHCRLSYLSYKFSDTLIHRSPFVDDMFQVMTLSGGQYPCQFGKFYLTFRTGKDLIEVSGNDVRNELKELACYVAAAEAQKVQQILNDGCVYNDMVGIIDQIEDQPTVEETAPS